MAEKHRLGRLLVIVTYNAAGVGMFGGVELLEAILSMIVQSPSARLSSLIMHTLISTVLLLSAAVTDRTNNRPIL